MIGMLASYFFIQKYSPGYLPLFIWKNETMASITTGHSSCRDNGNCSVGLLLSYHDNQSNATEQISHSGAQGILGTETATTFYEEADNKRKAFMDYFSKQFPIIESERFMIYTCSGSGLCGGWGDRLRGLYSVYLLSVLQNRSFGIEMNRPCPIEKFIRPAVLNWTIFKKSIIGKTTAQLRILDWKAPPLTLQKILSQVPTTDVVRLTFNEDYLDVFKTHTNIRERTPIISELPSVEIARNLYHGLFQYMDSFEKEIKDFFNDNFDGYHLIGVHIRVDTHRLKDTDLEQIWNFLAQYRNKTNYKIFIASDTQSVKERAKRLFSGQYVGLAGTIFHTDSRFHGSTNVCEGLKLSLFDHAILVRSQSLLLTPSGFGIEAARVRHTSNNLFCYVKRLGRIIRCQRESLKSLYHR